MWYSTEKWAGDLKFGLKLVKLSILPTLFIQFVWGSLGEFRSRYSGFKDLTKYDSVMDLSNEVKEGVQCMHKVF